MNELIKVARRSLLSIAMVGSTIGMIVTGIEVPKEWWVLTTMAVAFDFRARNGD
jgi:hypothetical protein